MNLVFNFSPSLLGFPLKDSAFSKLEIRESLSNLLIEPWLNGEFLLKKTPSSADSKPLGSNSMEFYR